MNKNETNYRLQFDNFIVNCCQCYENYWRSTRESNEEVFLFDYSIEKKKIFRKIFLENMSFFYFCAGCLKKAIFNIQFIIVTFQEYYSGNNFNQFFVVCETTCIAQILKGKCNIEDICNGCIQFMLERFKDSDVKII